MGNNFAIIFTKNNAIQKKGLTDEEAARLSQFPNVVVNPELKGLGTLSPHHWKLVDGQILRMTASERMERDKEHRVHGVDNDLSPYGFPRKIKKLIKEEIKIQEKKKEVKVEEPPPPVVSHPKNEPVYSQFKVEYEPKKNIDWLSIGVGSGLVLSAILSYLAKVYFGG